MTVATAAPEIPQPKVKIKSGSKTMFATAPTIMPIMDSLVEPSARISWTKGKVSDNKNAAYQKDGSILLRKLKAEFARSEDTGNLVTECEPDDCHQYTE